MSMNDKEESIVVMIVLVVIPILMFINSYTQRYVLDINDTATQGIFFKKTIYLKEYKNLGHGNGLFGEYDRYSRSDRHDEVLTVYED